MSGPGGLGPGAPLGGANSLSGLQPAQGGLGGPGLQVCAVAPPTLRA